MPGPAKSCRWNTTAVGRVPARQLPVKMCDAFPDVAEEVKAQVAQRLWGAPAPYPLTDEGMASEDEEAYHTK